MGYIVTANHTDDCAVDANITFSVKVANISLLFLSSIRINMTNITKLPEVIISDKPLKEKKGTTIDLTPEEDGLLVTITQVARGVNITKDQIAKSQLLFGSTYFDYTYHLYFPVPSSGKPLPLKNITFLEYQVLISSDRVLARFSWLSAATPCYPHPTYHILLRSPLSKNHHIEDYFATEINGTVYYQLNTTWYSDEYYNLTVVVGYGKDSRTEGITKQFTMTGPPTATTARVHVPPIIAGSLVGGIALIVLPIILCCFVVSCWCYRRNKQEAIKDVIWVGGEHDESEFEAFEPLRDMRLEPIQMDEWELPPHEIIMERKISDGNFGEVYKASIVSVTMHVKPGTPVAVKMLKFNTSESLKGDFLREIAIMKKISRNRSPFVVNLIGCCTLQEPFCLILEFVAHGDLLTYLRTMRRKVQKENDYCNVPSKQEMAMEKEGTERGTADQTVAPEEELEEPYWELGDLKPSHLLSFAYQIASGMEYLSNMSVVHRDLACRNILVDKDKMLKIADFGLSREGEMYISKTTGQVPLRWMSVETIRDRVFTTKSDVWSYGITLWEIGTLGGYPYPTHNNRELLEALQKGYRLSKPANCTNDIYLIMQQCWNEDPECRPSFSDLRCKMDHMLSSTHKENYIHLLVDEMQPYYNLVPAMERASHESLPSIESNSVGGECIQLETIDHTEDRTTSEARGEKDLLKASQYQVMISPQKKESTSEGLIESYL
jgi:proto-oncogene tyrosine-protein kinase Ret